MAGMVMIARKFRAVFFVAGSDPVEVLELAEATFNQMP
jgi:hypothetical protein